MSFKALLARFDPSRGEKSVVVSFLHVLTSGLARFDFLCLVIRRNVYSALSLTALNRKPSFVASTGRLIRSPYILEIANFL